MTDTGASKLSTFCTSLAVVGVLLSLAFNSGGAADPASTASAVPPITVAQVQG
ncbi:MAG: hypothetical protein ACT4O0_15855 [Pseudonocardia sp.]|jgi:hypothetical protein